MRPASRVLTIVAGVSGLVAPGVAAAAPSGTPELTPTPVPLPGSPGRVTMDYLAVDAATGKVWVPAGNTGRVDIVDAKTLGVTSVEGFATAARGERTLGPSSVTVGDGYAYVGDRADSRVCAVALKAPAPAGCARLESPPDGVAYVAATREVWVTTPRDRSLTILDVSSPAEPRVAHVIATGGQPEGYAVDGGRGLFYTNLEDEDATLVFDVRKRAEVARYAPGCGSAGPRGLALDAGRGLLVVACTDKLVTLSLADAGRKKGELATGGGVDNIDIVPRLRAVYAASAKTATLTVASLGDDGRLAARASAHTAEGARVVVADPAGTAWVADSAGGRLLVVRLPPGVLPE